MEFTEPGTIDSLVADATAAGHHASARLIRDWTELGLLDRPQRQPAGKGKGSRQALYTANQRGLFLTLLHHREGNKIKSLARIPVGIWMYWGDDFVPTRQVRIAMNTWLGDYRASLKQARRAAQEILFKLDNPAATTAARRELLDALAAVAYSGKADFSRLERAIRDVFEPNAGSIRKAIGHPAAPLMTGTIIGLIRARLTAIARLQSNDVTDEEFLLARHLHLVSFAEYALQHADLVRWAPSTSGQMYEPPTLESAMNSSCGNLLTVLGLMILNPDQAQKTAAQPVPQFFFQ